MRISGPLGSNPPFPWPPDPAVGCHLEPRESKMQMILPARTWKWYSMPLRKGWLKMVPWNWGAEIHAMRRGQGRVKSGMRLAQRERWIKRMGSSRRTRESKVRALRWKCLIETSAQWGQWKVRTLKCRRPDRSQRKAFSCFEMEWLKWKRWRWSETMNSERSELRMIKS